MSKKKGLSLEEKRTRMMEIFFETKDVFQLKDIEKIAPKTKGISPMTVKDVLQSLVDDNMVDCERVGTSNYYWAFPSKALHARKHKLEELQKQNSQAKQRKESLQKAVEKAKEGRQDTKERNSLLKELKALREERTELQADLEKYRECDPEVIGEMKKSNVVAKDAVTRWTDNQPSQGRFSLHSPGCYADKMLRPCLPSPPPPTPVNFVLDQNSPRSSPRQRPWVITSQTAETMVEAGRE